MRPQLLSIKQIKRNSDELRTLKERIRTTYAERRRSSEHTAEWEQACAEFHSRFDALSFPGGNAVFERVRQNDPDALEAALRFLVADPYHYRSGYMKEYLWKWLAHRNLSKSAVKRLEQAALGYLDRRISREFWAMCKTMAHIGTTAFWLNVASKVQSREPLEATRAYYLLIHGADLHSGVRIRRAINEACLARKYE